MKRIRNLARPLGAALLAGTLLASPCLSQAGRPGEGTFTLAGKHLRATFSRRTGGGVPSVAMTGLASPSGALQIDTSRSPLFKAFLYDPASPGDSGVLVIPPGFGPRKSIPSSAGVDIRGIEKREVQIAYRDLAIPGSLQRLSARLRIRVRPEDGVLEWTGAVRLTGKGKLVLGELRYPYLVLPAIGAMGRDDRLAVPHTGGVVLGDPICAVEASEEPPAPFGATSTFHYPGFLEAQFLAYYDAATRGDSDPTTGGLYLASEDPARYLKSLRFLARPKEGRLHLYVGHLNFAPDPIATKKDPTAELRSIAVSPSGKLPYVVVTDLFLGDWRDAADLYRAWLRRASPPFLARGPLHSRTDIPRPLKEAGYELAFKLAGGTAPIPTNDLAHLPEVTALHDVFTYFTAPSGSPLPVAWTISGDVNKTGEVGNANDNGVPPMRDGFIDLVRFVRRAPWASSCVCVAMNRDLGNWQSDRVKDPEPVIRNGLVRRPDLRPLQRPKRTPKDGLRAITCNASRFIWDMRIRQFDATVARTMAGSTSVIDNLVFSGKGSQPFLCFSPLSAALPRELHHHAVGGGNFETTEYRRLVHALQARYRKAMPRLFPAGERAHEQMIDCSPLMGRLRVDPWDATFHDRANWLRGGVPAPILPYLYHDWDLFIARLPRRSQAVTAYAKAKYGSTGIADLRRLLADPSYSALERQRYARLTVDGYRIGIYVQGPTEDPDLRVARVLDGPPGSAPPDVERNDRFLREMIRLRRDAAPYLVYGRMLRAPAVMTNGPPVRLEVLRAGSLAAVEKPGIAAGAWRAPDGSVAVVLVNYSGADRSARLVIDPAGWGVPPDQVLRFVDRAEHVVQAARGKNGRYRSALIAVPSGSPAKVLRIVSSL